jgi:5-methylcytosine-specific restriction protein B
MSESKPDPENFYHAEHIEPAQFAVVRLGADSEAAIRSLDEATAPNQVPFEITIECKQVPIALHPGAIAFIWLGTNNNKGGVTPWIQGLRAIGTIRGIEGELGYNEPKRVAINVELVLPKSLTKKDFIAATGVDYLAICDVPVVGINNYSSQVIQLVDSSQESQNVGALIQAIRELVPEFSEELQQRSPALARALATIQRSGVHLGRPLTPRLSEPETVRRDHGGEDPFFIELLARVKRLLEDGYGGVILRGPPGTSKTFYARLIGYRLVDGQSNRIRFIQFHPSYQYEDFVEGLVPDETGHFKLVAKCFVEACEAAERDRESTYVLVIDELSRTEPARVFGEALTYLESDKRGESFHLASGRSMSVPPNLVVLATMNVWDRGIDEVDAALERRFATIALDPRVDALMQILTQNGVEPESGARIARFFEALQHDPNPNVHIGHAYFRSVRDESGLHRLWDNQLRFALERAFPLERDGFERIHRLWRKSFPQVAGLDVDAALPPSDAMGSAAREA